LVCSITLIDTSEQIRLVYNWHSGTRRYTREYARQRGASAALFKLHELRNVCAVNPLLEACRLSRRRPTFEDMAWVPAVERDWWRAMELQVFPTIGLIRPEPDDRCTGTHLIVAGIVGSRSGQCGRQPDYVHLACINQDRCGERIRCVGANLQFAVCIARLRRKPHR
jgi:hypothetical protein